jgi:hypothetical protein
VRGTRDETHDPLSRPLRPLKTGERRAGFQSDRVRTVRRSGQGMLLVRCWAGRKISAMAGMLRHRFLQRARAFPPRTSAVGPSRRCGSCLLGAVLRWSRWHGDHPRTLIGCRSEPKQSGRVERRTAQHGGAAGLQKHRGAARRREKGTCRGASPASSPSVSTGASSPMLPWTRAEEGQAYSLSASGVR